jgi:hypothetical protein
MKIKEATILVTRRQKLGIIIHEQNNNQGLDSEVNSIGIHRRCFKRSLVDAAEIETQLAPVVNKTGAVW